MKRLYSIVALVLFLCTAACAGSDVQNSSTANANNNSQSSSNRGEAVLQLQGGKVSIEYGRPTLRGRDLEKLISPGEEWRMGSDTATTLTTDVDLKFGDKIVQKGKYVLKAKLVDKEKWHLIVLRDETTVAEIPLNLQKVDSSAEAMKIELQERSNGGRFVLQWGNLTLSTDFQKA